MQHLNGRHPPYHYWGRPLVFEPFLNGLSSLTLHDVYMDSAVIDVLRLCVSLTHIHLENITNAFMLSILVRHWPQLTSFSIVLLSYETINKLITSLTTYQHLKIFRYTITDVAYNAIFVTSYIVTKNLEEFYIRNSETVSDKMLRDLMAYGGNLRRISIIDCQGVREGVLYWDRDEFWPRLQMLLFAGCLHISLSFLELVLKNCKQLNEVILPDYPIVDAEVADGWMLKYEFTAHRYQQTDG